ncbi:MAG: hypothetical protein M3Y64_05180 [Gemmatimonadota bacterium]|nr:hypothetical protein [Gemmatimonadota bacterium]
MPPSISYSAIAAVASCALVVACGAGAPLAPDALKPETFELSLVNGQTPPIFAYRLTLSGEVWIKSARLKSIVAGRSIDPRIFEDRNGNGKTGGSSRDSTTAAAIVADIREFEERTSGGGTVVGMHTDTSAATIERRGDLLIITRDGPIARLVVVDTAHFVDGKLVFTAHEWERFGTPANALFIYSITN